MTGLGQSPSSPWVQSAQVRASQSFHPGLSPQQGSMPSNSDLPSPNYFGITVDCSSNPPMSNPGTHTQKNWGSFLSSLPSPKLQLCSQESVSEGLKTLLRTESEVDKSRRESAQLSFSASADSRANRTWSRDSHSPMTSGQANNWMSGSPSTYTIGPGQSSGAASLGKFFSNKPHGVSPE